MVQFVGVVPVDALDPRRESEERLRAVGFRVMQLKPQPSLERLLGAGFTASTGSAQGLLESSVSFNYTLWRHPENRADPRNELELNDGTRRALEEEPSWPRPQWLIDSAQAFRYPMVWEAVRTSWHANPTAPHASLQQQLLRHTNHILRNRFREQLGIPRGPSLSSERDWEAKEASIAPAVLTVDDAPCDAVHIDTDPLIYGVGVRLAPDVVCTVVIAREYLPFIDLAIAAFDPH